MTENPFPRNLEGGELILYRNTKGVIIPLVTPFLSETKIPKVDIEAFSDLISLALPHVNALFTTGNAGEGPSIDFESWSIATNTAIETRNRLSNKNTPVLAGVLRSNTEEIGKFASEAERLGADGIILAPMYGDRPEKTIEVALKFCNLPIILYNNPKLSGGKELPLDFIQQVVNNISRVIGIKSSSTDFQVFKKTLELQSDTFRVFQGNTEDAAKSLALGADGIVPAEACLDPILFANLYESYLHGNIELQNNLRRKVSDLLSDIKDKQRVQNMGTAHYIKAVLQTRKIFKSSRMYQL